MSILTVVPAETEALIDPKYRYDTLTSNGCTPHQAYTTIVAALQAGGHLAVIAQMSADLAWRGILGTAALEWAGMGWPPPWAVKPQ